jgi:hypothetical protein
LEAVAEGFVVEESGVYFGVGVPVVDEGLIHAKRNSN